MAKKLKKSNKVEKKSVVEGTPNTRIIHDGEDGKAIISLSIGATINMGNYESARVDLAMQIKVAEDNVEEGFEPMTELLHGELDKQVSNFTEE